MPRFKQKGSKRHTLSLRIDEELRGLIEEAAVLLGKDPAVFVLDAARQAAENTLLDRTVFTVDSDAYDAFQTCLDAPSRPNSSLRRSLQTAAPWEK